MSDFNFSHFSTDQNEIWCVKLKLVKAVQVEHPHTALCKKLNYTLPSKSKKEKKGKYGSSEH